MFVLSKLSLFVGLMCLALAGWSLIQQEVGDALFGLGLGTFLLLHWRWASAESRSSSSKSKA
jgi:hypothetical protein